MMGAGGFHSTGAAGAGGVLSLADACAVPFGAVPVAPVAGPVLEAAAAGANGLDAAAFNATAGGFDAGCADAAAAGGIDFLGTGGAAAEAMAGGGRGIGRVRRAVGPGRRRGRGDGVRRGRGDGGRRGGGR